MLTFIGTLLLAGGLVFTLLCIAAGTAVPVLLLLLLAAVGGLLLLVDYRKRKGLPFFLPAGREIPYGMNMIRIARVQADRGEIPEAEYERLKKEYMRKFGFRESNT